MTVTIIHNEDDSITLLLQDGTILEDCYPLGVDCVLEPTDLSDKLFMKIEYDNFEEVK